MVGVYPFGSAEKDRINVTADKGSVAWTPPGHNGRPLFHLGKRVFYPAGASAVRMAFAAEPAGIPMSIHDPDVVLSVLRSR